MNYIFQFQEDTNVEKTIKKACLRALPAKSKVNLKHFNCSHHIDSTLQIYITLPTKPYDTNFTFLISEFPTQCTWLILSKLTYRKDITKIQFNIATNICNDLGYAGFFVSGPEYLENWIELGAKPILSGVFNPHSDNKNTLLYVEVQ